MSESNLKAGLSLHRSEALTDGIFAVAMTLLVIELKLPEHSTIHSADAFAQALADLMPKIIAWVISFFVLAFFWFGHHRSFSYVCRADGKLVALNIVQLAFVSLMPFSSAMAGEHGRELASQIVYSLNMAAIAVLALLTWRYIHRHADASLMAIPEAIYRGARVRLIGLVLISAVAVGLQYVAPRFGNVAFMLMAVVMPISRRIERRGEAAASAPVNAPAA